MSYIFVSYDVCYLKLCLSECKCVAQVFLEFTLSLFFYIFLFPKIYTIYTNVSFFGALIKVIRESQKIRFCGTKLSV